MDVGACVQQHLHTGSVADLHRHLQCAPAKLHMPTRSIKLNGCVDTRTVQCELVYLVAVVEGGPALQEQLQHIHLACTRRRQQRRNTIL